MSKSIPHYINPWFLFRHNETISGTLDLSAMPNLCNSQNREIGQALVEIQVVGREDSQTVIRGEASTELELECQRCLKPLIDTFATSFELVLVKYERQLGNVNDEDDALVVEEQLELAPLIEQELILSLPMIAKHDNCQPEYKNIVSEEEVDGQQPFANLKDLLN